MPLLSVTEIRALIPSDLTDDALQTVLDYEDAAITGRFGAHYAAGATITEIYEGGAPSLWLNRPLASVSALTEATVGYTATTLTSDEYHVWAAQGRIERLPRGAVWGNVVTVTYTPADDNDRRISVLVDLVRLALERKALQSESIAGEYSYNTGGRNQWDTERAAILRRLQMGV